MLYFKYEFGMRSNVTITKEKRQNEMFHYSMSDCDMHTFFPSGQTPLRCMWRRLESFVRCFQERMSFIQQNDWRILLTAWIGGMKNFSIIMFGNKH